MTDNLFQDFQEALVPDNNKLDEPKLTLNNDPSSQASDLFSNFSGMSFSNGLFRVFDRDMYSAVVPEVNRAFLRMEERYTCFGYDWLGRVFALAKHPPFKKILMVQPGTGEALSLEVSLYDFLNHELVHFREDILAEGFFTRWSSTTGATLDRTKCAGYTLPLFLGGEDEVENLEVSDLDVYWTLISDLLVKRRDF